MGDLAIDSTFKNTIGDAGYECMNGEIGTTVPISTIDMKYSHVPDEASITIKHSVSEFNNIQ